MFSHILSTVKTTAAAHDTTGGMETKIAEAAMIARLGIDVYIVKVMTPLLQIYLDLFQLMFWELVVIKLNWMQAATSHALRALSGELRGNIPDDWSGTVIRFVSWDWKLRPPCIMLL